MIWFFLIVYFRERDLYTCFVMKPLPSLDLYSWISTYMLVGTAKECESVGQAGTDHADLIQSVISELCTAVSQKEGIEFAEGTLERLVAYTDVVKDFPCGVKEFEWRNEYFYKLGDEVCPIHNGLLRECQEKGFLGFEL